MISYWQKYKEALKPWKIEPISAYIVLIVYVITSFLVNGFPYDKIHGFITFPFVGK